MSVDFKKDREKKDCIFTFALNTLGKHFDIKLEEVAKDTSDNPY